jgi:hypothetical protein
MNADGSLEKTDKASGQPDAIIDEVKKRFQMCNTADSQNRAEALDDLTFLKGDQWPAKQKRQREMDGRPCLTINKLPTFLHQVTNDQRQNKAAIKVSPVGLKSNPKTAEIIQGMIRHIEYDSAADVAYDTALNSAAAIGFGYFRIVPEYEKDDSFNQVLRVKRIRNSFTVSLDPAGVEPDGSDIQFGIVTEKMTHDEFKARHPRAEITTQGFDFRTVGGGVYQDWIWDNMVRVAEYYKFEYEPAMLYQLADGTTTFDLPQGVVPKAKRMSVKKKLMWYKISPLEVLEKTQIMCDWIPIFPVYGEEIDIDGEIYRCGLIRNAKDPAMMYNFWMTSATEEVSLRPKTPFIGAIGQFEGQEKRWAQANTRSFPYLEYNAVTVEGQLAPPPSRQPMADVPVGVLTMAQHANDNIKATTGLFDSSMGAAGNATSGKQELAQQKQGNVANYHFTDNFFRTLRHAGKCMLNMIPHYYDTERVIQIMNEDGTQSSAVVNSLDTEAAIVINDLTIGDYAVTISVGPSYATMRAEAADAMVQFGQSWPKLMDIAGDQVVKAMNWPGADDIAKRIARTIPPEIMNDPDETGKPAIPPEIQQRIDEMEQEIQELAKEADANHAKVTAEEIKKEAAIEVANIRAESAADVAELTGLVKILIARMPAPPELVQEVSEDLAEHEGGSGEVEAPEGQPMNAAPMPEQE